MALPPRGLNQYVFEVDNDTGNLLWLKPPSKKDDDVTPLIVADFSVKVVSVTSRGFLLQITKAISFREILLYVRTDFVGNVNEFRKFLKESNLDLNLNISMPNHNMFSNYLMQVKQEAIVRAGGEEKASTNRIGYNKDSDTWVFNTGQYIGYSKERDEYYPMDLKYTPVVLDDYELSQEHITLPRLPNNWVVSGLNEEDFWYHVFQCNHESKEFLTEYVDCMRLFFRGNFAPAFLTLAAAWMCTHYHNISEDSYPVVNCVGIQDSKKTEAVKCALAVTGFGKGAIASSFTESKLYQNLSCICSMPVVWDDPDGRDEAIGQTVKALWNGEAREVRGNKQKPMTGVLVTSNVIIGISSEPALSRLTILPFRSNPGSGNAREREAYKRMAAMRKEAGKCILAMLSMPYDESKADTEYQHLTRDVSFLANRARTNYAVLFSHASQMAEYVGVNYKEEIEPWIRDTMVPFISQYQKQTTHMFQFLDDLEALHATHRIDRALLMRKYQKLRNEKDPKPRLLVYLRGALDKIKTRYATTMPYGARDITNEARQFELGHTNVVIRFVQEELEKGFQGEIKKEMQTVSRRALVLDLESLKRFYDSYQMTFPTWLTETDEGWKMKNYEMDKKKPAFQRARAREIAQETLEAALPEDPETGQAYDPLERARQEDVEDVFEQQAPSPQNNSDIESDVDMDALIDMQDDFGSDSEDGYESDLFSAGSRKRLRLGY